MRPRLLWYEIITATMGLSYSAVGQMAAKFNDATSFPIQAGHPCIGCSEPDFWGEIPGMHIILSRVPAAFAPMFMHFLPYARMENASFMELPELEQFELTILLERNAAPGFLSAPGVFYLIKTDKGSILFDLGYGLKCRQP